MALREALVYPIVCPRSSHFIGFLLYERRIILREVELQCQTRGLFYRGILHLYSISEMTICGILHRLAGKADLFESV